MKVFRWVLLCVFFPFQIANGQDTLLNIMKSEVDREMATLAKQEIPAYYISYRVDDTKQFSLSTSMGALVSSGDVRIRFLTVCVRVGSMQLDNYHPVRDNSSNSGYSLVDLPIDNNSKAIKQILWDATNDAYQQAVVDYTKAKTNVAVKVREGDKSPDFSPKEPSVYIDSVLNFDLIADKDLWTKRMKSYSSKFLSDTAIYSGLSVFSVSAFVKRFVSSEGDQIAQARKSADIAITGITKADDGMDIPLIKTYTASVAAELPSDADISNETDEMVSNLKKLRVAPVAEPYTGPALLSGRSAAVFFHEIFGHRIEGQRLKNEYDAQTFRKKVNELVLPAHMNVYCDPTLRTLGNIKLNGFYKYDDQGAKAERVTVVENGILKDFLMSRTPIDGFPKSNGHGRSQYGLQPVSRQSNLLVQTTQPRSRTELRAELVKQVKEAGKSYGYYFDDVVGGFTTTGRYMPNAFNVFPTLVYRVYADGRADELVRGVDLVGTPLSMFSHIDMAGDQPEVFNGVCGAESGSVPVSASCPSLLVKNIETQKNAKSQDNFIMCRPNFKN